MFRSVIYETWLDWVPYVAFGITAAVFITFVIRAIALKKESMDHMARLPLDD
ncbi:MAG: hypothetical protein OJI67_03645 [Prosthecobacter sp.]|nr:hypothetical protein [Prosthecobacter sp.]